MTQDPREFGITRTADAPEFRTTYHSKKDVPVTDLMNRVPSERDFAGLLKAPDRFFIDGAWVKPASPETRRLMSPGSGREFLSVAMAGAEDVERAVTAARRAFDSGPWPRLAPAERAVYLRAIGRELAARAEALAGLQTAEMGALHGLTTMLIPRLVGVFDFYSGLADRFAFVEKHQPAMGGAGYLVHEPAGVAAAIIPWNGPLMLACWKLAPALLAGCTVILKGSPEAPSALLAFAEAVEAAGLPAGVFNLINADREVSELLVRHPGVDKVSFTGSTLAGRKIGAICADRIARCSLELGGKSPALLLDDYDVDLFADKISAAAVMMSGQVCAGLTRAIVPRAMQARVVDALAARFEKVVVGDPFDRSSGMGPMASARHCARVMGYIERGQAEGSRMVTGGVVSSPLDPSFYVAPTLFADVANSATIAREEIFGPVLCVLPVDSEEEAIAVANDTAYGLNSAVFTSDADRAFQVARRLRAGTVGHNGFKIDFTIGFGGFKQSGLGREGGILGLRAFLEPKTVLLDEATTGAA